eukprot:SAG22_NODE_1767_length_3617_cov_2.767766_3_plen_47_part_00
MYSNHLMHDFVYHVHPTGKASSPSLRWVGSKAASDIAGGKTANRRW